MSEDPHYSAPLPLPEAMQDHAPTDKLASKGLLYTLGAVFVISVIALSVIYANENPVGRPEEAGPGTGHEAPAPTP